MSEKTVLKFEHPRNKAKSIIAKLDDKIIELRSKIIKGLDNE